MVLVHQDEKQQEASLQKRPGRSMAVIRERGVQALRACRRAALLYYTGPPV